MSVGSTVQELPGGNSDHPRQPGYPNLLRGGVPGHDGSNAGRPPAEVREVWRRINVKSAVRIESKLDDPGLSDGTLAKYADVSGKYGLGEKTWNLDESQQTQAIGQATADFFASLGTPELFDQWVRHVEEHVKSL